MARFMPLREAVAENLNSGDVAAFEGFTHLIPMAAAHEALRDLQMRTRAAHQGTGKGRAA